MTISTASPRTSFNCDGVSTVFPVPMQAYLATDFLVILTAPVSGGSTEVTQVLNSDYSLAAAGTLKPTAWTLTSLSATPYPIGYTLQVIVNPVQTQQTQYVQNQAFPSLAVQTNLDRLTQMAQRLQDQVNRTPRAPDGDYAPSMLLPPAIQRALGYLGFDSNGNAVVVPSLPGSNFTQQSVGVVTNPITTSEALAGVVPTFYNYSAMDPRRYGAVGDNATDDTVAINKFIAVANAAPGQCAIWPVGLNYLCGQLNPLTAANFTWAGQSSSINTKPNSSVPAMIELRGANTEIHGLTVNGNQLSFSANTGGHNIVIRANDCTLKGVDSVNACGYGLIIDSNVPTTAVRGTLLDSCHIDGNATFGSTWQNVTYTTCVNTTFNRNGYGFHNTFATNAFTGFGLAIRLRSNHNTLINVRASQNGRDGLNVNQGSYATKFAQCVTWMNGDGGITVASDNTGSGRPGEGEACYDNEAIDCESYDNWSSGFAAYTTTYNLQIIGGRYYNNGRFAGSLASAQQTTAGIYINSSSLGVNIDTKCYDDQQICPVTANAAGVLSATGWVAGTAANYPKVALYNAALAFQGYATITSEASGTLTISVASLPFNPVTIASIASGWFVTQRMQLNGCYFDPGCTATVAIDGFGHLTGPAGFGTGYKVYSAPGTNQNVQNTRASAKSVELLASPSWDSGLGAGTSWNYAIGAGGSLASYTTTGANLHSPAALLLTGGTSSDSHANGVLITGGNNYAQDCWFEYCCEVTAVNAGDANISVTWDTSSSMVTHPGGGTKTLMVCGFLPSGNSGVTPQVLSAPTKANVFDEGSFKVCRQPFDNRDFFYPSRNLPT